MTEQKPAESAPKKRRGGSSKRQRQMQYVVRCTKEEFNAIAAKASSAGLKGAAFLRAAGLGDAGPRAQRRLPVDAQMVRQVLGLHGRIGNNMNQIAYELHAHGEGALENDFRQALKEWGEIRDAMLTMLGKNIQPATSGGQRPE